MRRRGLHSCAAPRPPSMPVSCAKFANRCPYYRPANRCAHRDPTSVSPVATGFAKRCLARDALSLPRAVPHCALGASLRSCGLRRRGPHFCAAPRRPRMSVPCAQFANRCPYSRPANHCGTRPPAVAQRLSRPLPPASRALPRARRSKPAARGATSRSLRASLRVCGLLRRGPHFCAALRRPRMSVPLSQVANSCPILCRQTVRCQRRRRALPRARRSKPAARGATSRALRAWLRSCGVRRRGLHFCAAPRRPRMSVPRAQLAIRDPYSLPANRCVALPPAVAQRLSRPVPPASRGATSCATL